MPNAVGRCWSACPLPLIVELENASQSLIDGTRAAVECGWWGEGQAGRRAPRDRWKNGAMKRMMKKR